MCADLKVHDLIEIDASSFDGAASPCWVRQSLSLCPWVVVRRVQAPAGMIAVGVRGDVRAKRWGGFLEINRIRGVARPEALLVVLRSAAAAHQARTPALRTLAQVVEQWKDLPLLWGPTGSVGLELASHSPVTTQESDLDIVIRAPGRWSAEEALAMWNRVSDLRPKVDARIETSACGFSLEEYSSQASSELVLRYPEGSRFGRDPWADGR